MDGLIIANQNVPRVTNGQAGLHKLIQTKIAEKKPITMKDLAECYSKFVCKTMYISRLNYDYTTKKWLSGNISVFDTYLDKNASYNWTITAKIHQWLRSNIGSLVLKGMLTVIPAIEIDYNSVSIKELE